MSALGITSLFIAMLVLALTPGPGVFIVVASALNSGLRKSIPVIAGIIFGDYVFILLVLSGLQAIAAQLGGVFMVLKYAGAAYLVWLGMSLLSTRPGGTDGVAPLVQSDRSAFATGLVVTLSNPKAIFFYLSFFPAFVDPQSLTVVDVLIIMLLVTVVLFATMLMYAWLATQAGGLLLHRKKGRLLRLAAAGILVGSGAMVALRA